MQNVLIVEDSKTFSHVLQKALKNGLEIETTICATYKEAVAELEKGNENYFAALLDLNLPDAPYGEIVDYIVSKGIPPIIFTSEMSDDLRDQMWAKGIVDYVLKETPENVQIVVDLIQRLKLNLGLKILVAEDSAVSRNFVKKLLEVWNLSVLEAANGQKALDMLMQDNSINMLLTDYNMPELDGVSLVKKARQIFSKTRLPIIGISGVGGATMSAYFLKAGANDYLHKPFLAEELYCRVRHNIETSEYIYKIRELAERDFMTGLFNRRSFYSYAGKLFASAQRDNISLVVGMLDIDYFKRCNDTYGHEAGDQVLCFVADILKSRFREDDLVSRFGGEEFCVVCVNMQVDNIEKIFNEIRASIEDAVINFQGQEIKVTISIGVCATLRHSLDKMITCADDMLYEAKNQGRNQLQVAR